MDWLGLTVGIGLGDFSRATIWIGDGLIITGSIVGIFGEGDGLGLKTIDGDGLGF